MEHLDLYAKLMAKGFQDDPGVRIQFTGMERAKELFELFCKYEIEAFHRLGCVKTYGDGQGLAIGFFTKDTPNDMIAGSLQESSHHLTDNASMEELTAMQNNALIVAEVVKPDWYLNYLEDDSVYVFQVLVIEESVRGTGIFRSLITPILETARRRKIPVVLQTHDHAHVAKYERFGFELMETVVSNSQKISCYNMMNRHI